MDRIDHFEKNCGSEVDQTDDMKNVDQKWIGSMSLKKSGDQKLIGLMILRKSVDEEWIGLIIFKKFVGQKWIKPMT